MAPGLSLRFRTGNLRKPLGACADFQHSRGSPDLHSPSGLFRNPLDRRGSGVHGLRSRKLRTTFHSPTTTLESAITGSWLLACPFASAPETSTNLWGLAPISSTPSLHLISTPLQVLLEPSGSKRSTSFTEASSPPGTSPGSSLNFPALSCDHAFPFSAAPALSPLARYWCTIGH